ncbi:MAG: hypothetical protein JXN59_08925 [Anaerolineae bacterium]|nr:hypothetical protein [Anaerolineae bacterium]
MPYRVFLAHTPLHLLLTLSLIQTAPECPALVLLYEDFPGAARLITGLRELWPAPHRVNLLPGTHSYPRTLQHPAYQRLPLARLTNHLPPILAARRALRLTRPFAIDWVGVFSDLRPDVQQIAGGLKARHPGCRVAYVEHGTTPYIDTLAPEFLGGKRAAWAFRLVYGPHFQQVTGTGQFAALDEAHLIYPAHANAALRRLPCHPLLPPRIPPDELRGLFPLPPPESPAASAPRVALVLPPRARTLSSATFAQLQAAITRCAADGLTPLLKLHPREMEPERFRMEGVIVLDRATPSEIVVSWLGPRLARVISVGNSTALYTARWLNPAAEAVLFLLPDVPVPPEMLRLYRALGVTMQAVGP